MHTKLFLPILLFFIPFPCLAAEPSNALFKLAYSSVASYQPSALMFLTAKAKDAPEIEDTLGGTLFAGVVMGYFATRPVLAGVCYPEGPTLNDQMGEIRIVLARATVGADKREAIIEVFDQALLKTYPCKNNP